MPGDSRQQYDMLAAELAAGAPGAHAERWPALARAALRYAGGPAVPD
jgi:hypothetical protein